MGMQFINKKTLEKKGISMAMLEISSKKTFAFL